MFTIEELIQLVWTIFSAMLLYRIFCGVLTSLFELLARRLRTSIDKCGNSARIIHEKEGSRSKTIGFKSIEE